MIVIVAASVGLLIISFLGCWGALRENHCMLVSYGVLLLIIIIVEVAVGTLAFLYSNQVEDMAYKQMKMFIDEYKMDQENVTATRIIDDLQKNLKCCGSYNYTDWTEKFDGKLPLSCCGKLKSQSALVMNNSDSFNSSDIITDSSRLSNETCLPNEAFQEGCTHKIWNLAIEYYGPIGGVLIGVAVIQLLGFILSCAFAHSIKKDYEVV